MERLTKRDGKGRAYFDDDGVLIRGANGTFHHKKDMFNQYIHQRFVALDKAIDRLAVYEDTGLLPEEIMALIEPKIPQEGKGLYAKYTVIKTETGEAVKDCFILRPGKDPAAATAIRAYANATTNRALADDLRRWVGEDPNPPLTLEELREMDGEPVYCVNGGTIGRWAIVNIYGNNQDDFECWSNSERIPGWTYGMNGISGWLAYRRKPEEGAEA